MAIRQSVDLSAASSVEATWTPRSSASSPRAVDVADSSACVLIASCSAFSNRSKAHSAAPVPPKSNLNSSALSDMTIS
eukprot:7387705-Prymnesium_polylepis.2